MKKVKAYIGTKIIKAYECDNIAFLRSEGKETESVDKCPGYIVVYPDNYRSWSPKDVFEHAYREISENEKNLVIWVPYSLKYKTQITCFISPCWSSFLSDEFAHHIVFGILGRSYMLQ